MRVFWAVMCAAALLIGAPEARAAEEPVHILLIGVDGREEGRGRSDAVLLCSFVPGGGRVVMTSFLRDLYIPIPGHGHNRLNAAYAIGGRKLLRETLEAQFGLDIRGSVEVDFERFPQLIDVLGGVELELRADEAEYICRSCPGSHLIRGRNTLSGAEALCFARIRTLDADGDFSRTRRQQRILRALLDRWRQADAGELLELAGEAMGMVTTDLNPVQLLSWVFRMAPTLENLEVTAFQVPAAGTYRFRRVRGMDVLEADWQRNIAALRACIDQQLPKGGICREKENISY
ncbi:MAG: LCP family protein [Faecousia sp.]